MTRVRFTTRGPWTPPRQSFSISRDEISPDGTRRQTPVKDKRIESLNQQYASGMVDLHQGRLALADIKRQLEAEASRHLPKHPLAPYNVDIANRFIQAEILSKRKTRQGSKTSAISGVNRCLTQLGSHSLRTVTQTQLQDITDAYPTTGGNKALCVWMNALLRFAGRPDRVTPRSDTYKPPAYLTHDEVAQLIEAVPTDTHPLLPDLLTIIYNTGCRFSEALALTPASRGRLGPTPVVLISRQYVARSLAKSEADRLRVTKNGKERTVVPLDWRATFRAIERWCAAYPEIPQREIYRTKTGEVIKSLCATLFGKQALDPDDEFMGLTDFSKSREYKRCHMLRASCAVRLIELGAPLESVAVQLGDSLTVTERHYAGFVNNESSAQRLAKLVKVE